MSSLTEEIKIIIVGGGIAGLASAIALRSPRHRITILERSRMLRETGALISLQPNATKIVNSWDISSFLEPCQPMVDKAFRLFDVSGKLVNEVHLDTSMFGADRILYHRQDLHSALLQAATSPKLPGPPAEVLTGKKISSCDPEAGLVRTEDGEEYVGDVVVGADGIHSVLRNSIVGEPRAAIPTGISAYRVLLPVEQLAGIDIPKHILDPSNPVTTMVVGHDRRVIMGPGRGGSVFGIVALVPDSLAQGESAADSWVAPGSVPALLEAYKDFPEWMLEIFRRAPDVALWQLRDIDPLPTWVRGRAILIGDAAHAMLPTQGQGASQSIEDAEALAAYLVDLPAGASGGQVNEVLREIFDARYERASLIQKYSRQQARPGTDANSNEVKLNPGQFMKYNCAYEGAKKWAETVKGAET
ncbi:hypothetical protein JX265_001138 [Neoarthrinium moseri]|uniref:FAD-binding domain-containing protein n=1 Tax=Neoarthrinium moseri TaxID=1658444 RepID=A0A9P9WXH2_9PEZI|nr:uncharacterized protein JN550_007312 [Neoarthrinium moseri]KAI1866765.1 hypothetical protein JN550_007312 [Neoarthrinium moseri]KAI1880898.1 hypothetical protein JX265_001138 [Neoarthrinium moseri]